MHVVSAAFAKRWIFVLVLMQVCAAIQNKMFLKKQEKHALFDHYWLIIFLIS